MFKVVRIYRDKYRKYTIAYGLTEAEAQEMCRDPESSSNTCITATAKATTRRNGPWFNSYEKA